MVCYRHKRLRPAIVCIAVFLLLASVFRPAMARSIDPAALRTQKAAMDLARSGDLAGALGLLEDLANQYPDHFPFRRDVIVVAGRKGDCPRLLRHYSRLKPGQRLLPVTVVPAARCERQRNRVRAAIRMLELARVSHPRHRAIQTELKEARAELANQRLTAELELNTNSSDAGNREWRLGMMVWGEVADHVTGRARFLTSRAQDPVFVTGDLNRVAVGAEYHTGRLDLDGEVSGDLVRVNEIGLSLKLGYEPRDRWHVSAAHHTFSEEVPLRAKALNVSSNQWQFSTNWHSSDYVWEWSASASMFDYSDTNRRREWYSELAYGFDLKPKKEQRAVMEVSQASNTLAGTVYFNPISAQSLLAGYKYLWLPATRYKRHANELFLWVADYSQQGYGSAPMYGVRFSQDFDINDVFAWSWQAGYASKVYDGNREAEINAGISLKRTF